MYFVLQIVWLSGNPLSSEPGYRGSMIKRLQQIKKLDNVGEHVTAVLTYTVHLHVHGSENSMQDFKLHHIYNRFLQLAVTDDKPSSEDEVKGDDIESGRPAVLNAVLLLLSELNTEELGKVKGQVEHLLSK